MKNLPHVIPLTVFLLWLLHMGAAARPALAAAVSPPATSSPSFAVMREALQHALHLRFTEALETTTQLEHEQQPTLASRLTRGMIAYFQVRWQTSQSPAARQAGHESLQAMLAEGQKQLTTSAEEPHLRLFLGLAAIFDALLQQQNNAWTSMQLFAQGQSWLQKALIADETMADAHLGLGLLYFAGADLSPLLRWVWGNIQGQRSSADILHHMQRAAESGHFTQEVAQTFLARIYELEKRYEDAIVLGQTLQEAFPENGYYVLLTGRSQCAKRQYEPCAHTLGRLVAGLKTAEAMLRPGDDRFDLFYFWGLALHETGQYAEAFQALRQAINEDPQARKDESLWAKYYLAMLYERRGQTHTARQIYHTLLRGRNTEELHHQVQRRLRRLE